MCRWKALPWAWELEDKYVGKHLINWDRFNEYIPIRIFGATYPCALRPEMNNPGVLDRLQWCPTAPWFGDRARNLWARHQDHSARHVHDQAAPEDLCTTTRI